MREQLLNGVPVQQGTGWVVLRLSADGSCWFPLMHTVRTRRADAIAAVDETMSEPGFYERCQRRGEMRATWVAAEPVCYSETTGRRSRRREIAG